MFDFEKNWLQKNASTVFLRVSGGTKHIVAI